jgi:transcriptional regulator with XRE-family HTH domain
MGSKPLRKSYSNAIRWDLFPILNSMVKLLYPPYLAQFPPEENMNPGLRMRQARERLELTYRDVERASYEMAARWGRPEFIMHISRLADIENRDVVPGLHKLYTLAAIYRLKPAEILGWYDVPIEECFHDGTNFPVPRTHVMAAPTALRIPMTFDSAFDPWRTPLLRAGSIVQVDGTVRKIENSEWATEHDRPMHFVEDRDGYRCGWFY